MEVADLDVGIIPDPIARLARKLYYSAEWSRAQATKPWIVRHMIDTYGVTEADIRDIRYAPHADMVIVRLKNWRTFPISGIDLFRAEEAYINGPSITPIHSK